MGQLLRALGILCLMAASGVGSFIITLFVLMSIGGHFYGAYDYLGRYPALLWTPTGVGFSAPLVILWWLEKKGVQGRRALVETAQIGVFCVICVWSTFDSLGSGTPIRARIVSGGLALACSAMAVWLLVRREKD
jgi:hypothetical protein